MRLLLAVAYGAIQIAAAPHRFRELGCTKLCLLPRMHGHGVACVELNAGEVRIPYFANHMCGWHASIDASETLRKRLNTYIEVMRSICRTSNLTGTVLIETGDGMSLDQRNIRTLSALGVLVFAPSAPREMHLFRSTSPASEVWDGRAILVPDCVFLKSRGYEKQRQGIEEASNANPWPSKRRQAVFRGSCTGRVARTSELEELRGNLRLSLSIEARQPGHEAWDVGVVNFKQQQNSAIREKIDELGLIRPKMSATEMLHFHAIFDVDGNTCAWEGTFWKLLGNSVAIKLGIWDQWYYDRLVDGVHYVSIKSDLSDAEEKVNSVLDPAKGDAVQKIARASSELMRSITFESETDYVKRVLEAAFGADVTPRRGEVADALAAHPRVVELVAAFERFDNAKEKRLKTDQSCSIRISTCPKYPNIAGDWFDDHEHGGGPFHDCARRVSSWRKDCCPPGGVNCVEWKSPSREQCFIQISGVCAKYPQVVGDWFDDLERGGTETSDCRHRAGMWKSDCGEEAHVACRIKRAGATASNISSTEQPAEAALLAFQADEAVAELVHRLLGDSQQDPEQDAALRSHRHKSRHECEQVSGP